MPLIEPGLVTAMARALPAAVLVPAWGLAGGAFSTRMFVAACLAWPIAPAMAEEPVWLSLARGLPVAISAAIPLWLASTHGAIADALLDVRGPFARLSAVLGAMLFFASAGPVRVSEALMLGADAGGAGGFVSAIAAGFRVALFVAGPLLAGSVALAAVEAALLRGAGDAALADLGRGGRRIVLLLLAAIMLDRTMHGLAELVGR